MKTVRVYVNWLDDRKGMRWSIDYGTTATEQTVRGVRVYRANGRARVDMKAKRAKGQPSAWIEYEGVDRVVVTKTRRVHIYGV